MSLSVGSVAWRKHGRAVGRTVHGFVWAAVHIGAVASLALFMVMQVVLIQDFLARHPEVAADMAPLPGGALPFGEFLASLYQIPAWTIVLYCSAKVADFFRRAWSDGESPQERQDIGFSTDGGNEVNDE